MVDEATEDQVQSNPILLYKILMNIDSKSVNLGLNIPAGKTIFQVMRDTDFSEVKKNDLEEDLERQLASIYGGSKSPDQYSYEVREDGSLVLASVEDEAPLLQIANETRDIYSGKMKILSIYPDEVALLGLLRANYDLEDAGITALVQFNPDSCRIVFTKGEQILQVMPLINQGTKSANFLNVVFSKLLFQLDTGEVPRLDQIILTDNIIGEEAVEFFHDNFPDVPVESFEYDTDKFDASNCDKTTLQAYTSAIAAAWSATGVNHDQFSLPIKPAYVSERQKIFKLRWHGMVLVFLIFISIPAFNYFYQAKKQKIASLSSQLARTNNQIKQIQPVVNKTNQVANNLTLLTSKLRLLDSLSQGSRAWSTKLNILDQGMAHISHSWFNTMSVTKGGMLIKGYTLHRNRIPAIVDLFADASLLNVNSQKIRGQMVYSYALQVKQFTQDSSKYSPEKPASVKKILNK